MGAGAPHRWMSARKAQLIRDFSAGLISAQEVERDHSMSGEELHDLVGRYGRQGEAGLKAKHVREARI